MNWKFRRMHPIAKILFCLLVGVLVITSWKMIWIIWGIQVGII